MKHAWFRNTVVLSILAMTGVSCASTQRAAAVSKAGIDEVWKACIDSLADVRFSATSASKDSGLIVADQAVVGGHGSVSRLNIMVEKVGSGTSVKITFIPPPGTVGGGGTADEYVMALKKRVPALQVSQAKE